ncbi:piezo-type mechanosensitive ion channel component 1-like protein, partial [Lates japonicus]
MDLQVIVWLFYCFLLPSTLLTACLFRYNILSLVYFLYLLLLPCFLCPNKHTIRGHTGRFIRAVLCTSLLFLLAHICFQTVLYTYPPLDSAIGVALITVILCSRLVRNREMVAAANITSLEDDPSDKTTDEEEEDDDDEEEEEEEEASGDEDEEDRSLPGDPDEEVSTATKAKQLAEHLKAKARKVLRDLGRILAISLLALAGITLPSAFSAIYFLLFIGVCTWWAYHLPISHLGFNALCVMVGFFTAGHMVCLYLYQSLLAQALFPPHSLWA